MQSIAANQLHTQFFTILIATEASSIEQRVLILAVLILLAQLMGLLILHEFIIEEHTLSGLDEIFFNCKTLKCSARILFLLY